MRLFAFRGLLQAVCPHWNRFEQEHRDGIWTVSTVCPACGRREYVLGDKWVSETEFERWFEEGELYRQLSRRMLAEYERNYSEMLCSTGNASAQNERSE